MAVKTRRFRATTRMLLCAVCGVWLLLGVPGCQDVIQAHTWLRVVRVDGTPYLILQNSSPHLGTSRFGVYRPRTGKAGGRAAVDALADWETVKADLLGPVFGACAWRAPDGRESLVVLHHKRASFFSFPREESKKEEPEKNESGFETGFFIGPFVSQPRPFTGETPQRAMLLPFDWTAEAGAMLNGKLYVFGREGTEDPEQQASSEGRLRAASFDGKKWKALRVKGPQLKGESFVLDAVKLGERIHVFYRPVSDADDSVLQRLTFDGKTFSSQPQRLEELPKGSSTFWTDGRALYAAVQPRGTSLFSNKPLQLWRLPADHGTVPDRPTEVLARSESRRSPAFRVFLLGHGVCGGIGAEGAGGTEFIVRSDTQELELWVRSGEGADDWTMLRGARLKGLPRYKLGLVFGGLLAACLAAIAFGAGLAWRRHKRWKPDGKLQPGDVYGSPLLRAAAYLCDFLTVWCLDLLVKQFAHLPEVWHAPQQLLLGQSLCLFVVYLLYFTAFEWRWSATPGKFLMSLRIIRESGDHPNFGAAFLRNFIGFFERQPQTLPFAVFTVLLTPRRQRLGDLIPKTLVVQNSMLEAVRKRHLRDSHSFGRRSILATEPPLDAWPGRSPDADEFDDWEDDELDDEFDDELDEDWDEDEWKDDEFKDKFGEYFSDEEEADAAVEQEEKAADREAKEAVNKPASAGENPKESEAAADKKEAETLGGEAEGGEDGRKDGK